MAEPVPTERTPVPPHFSDVAIKVGSLGDYLGLPTDEVYDEQTGGVRKQYNTLEWVSAAPYAAYQKFFNDWFRDENLYNNGEEVDYMLNDGVNSFAKFDVLRKRAWRHDYFTSSLPFAQKGEAVEIPIANFTDVNVKIGKADWPSIFRKEDGSIFNEFDTNLNLYSPAAQANFAQTTVGNGQTGRKGIYYDPNGSLVAETSKLSNAAAVTVNTLRWAENYRYSLKKMLVVVHVIRKLLDNTSVFEVQMLGYNVLNFLVLVLILLLYQRYCRLQKLKTKLHSVKWQDMEFLMEAQNMLIILRKNTASLLRFLIFALVLLICKVLIVCGLVSLPWIMLGQLSLN